jgi:hypothetical protein
MNQEDIQKALEAIGKSGINVAGDLVIEKNVEYEVNNVENGGIGIQIINGKAETTTPFIPCELKFFDQSLFGSEEKQPKLIEMLNRIVTQIDTKSGRGWFAVYAGYRYFKNQLAVKGDYSNFFTDIENLLPGVLTKIDTMENGDKRYHNYTQLLGREVDAWYMDKGKLPPINEITTWKSRFDGDNNRYENSCIVINQVWKQLKQI